MGRYFFLVLLFVLSLTSSEDQVSDIKPEEVTQKFSSCNLDGVLEDCPCTVETIEKFNYNFNPSLLKLLETDYFRYFEVDFTSPCKWGWDTQCTSPNCGVETCNKDNVPEEVRNGNQGIKKTIKEKDGYISRFVQRVLQIFPFLEPYYMVLFPPTPCDHPKDPYPQHHDVVGQQFCKLDPLANPATCDYVDLVSNPEQFTGYSGEAAHKVWDTIYNELCFHPETKDKTLYLTSSTARSMCLEKRAFYKLVSGLHSSISVHLCSKYLLEEGAGLVEPVWGRNFQEFRKRFSPESTNLEGPERLKNIYFLYLVELRAVEKIAPLLKDLNIYTKEEKIDMVKEVINEVKSFPSHFDECELFKDESMENKELLKLYKENFLKISELMDCLGCERCKVWGKLQVTGIGTALKILFTPVEELILTKHEIVALFNALGRHSTSIRELDFFKEADI